MAHLRSVVLLCCCAAALVLACGDEHPGGTVGDPCEDVGDSSECAGGEICDDLDGGGAYCLKICEDHADSDPDERCNGVSGSSTKGCHPEEDDDDCELTDDCGKQKG